MKNNIVYLIISYIFDKQKQTIMYNKSIIFKSAHAIYKMQNITFSEALKMSWLAYKNQVKVIVTESWNKIKRVAFTKNGTTSGSIENVISAVRVVVDNVGARHDYGCGIFNND